MKYIFMVAGKGTRLHPLTLKHPKSIYKLDENTTLLQRMVQLIKKYDKDVLDGSSFNLYVKTDNDLSVEASGYMKWPKNYREVRGELESFFKSL